jgi:hypothetical protein
VAKCIETLNALRSGSPLAVTLAAQVVATWALRQALTAADAASAEASEGTEQLGLHLTARLEQLGKLHGHILHAAQQTAAAVTALGTGEAGEGELEESDDVTDDLATEAPIPAATLTFGTTPFETVAAALALVEARYGLEDGNLEEGELGGGAWLDLGSGDGGPTLAAGLLRRWPLGCGGLEVRKSLHRNAEHVALAFAAARARGDVEAACGDGSFAAALRFENGDLRRRFGGVQPENVGLLFLHATCFDDGLMHQVATKLVPRLPAGSLVVSASKPLPSAALQTLEARRLPFR